MHNETVYLMMEYVSFIVIIHVFGIICTWLLFPVNKILLKLNIVQWILWHPHTR